MGRVDFKGVDFFKKSRKGEAVETDIRSDIDSRRSFFGK
jgi:hypothetical protein